MDSVPQLCGFPSHFTIETARICNARCVFCAINAWSKQVPFMEDALFEKIADEILRHRSEVRQVCLNGSGEPMLDRAIASRVARLKSGGIEKVILTTNASLLDESRAEDLLEAGLDELLVSFNGLDKEKYESLRVGLSFEKVMRNTCGFVDLRNRKRPGTVIRMRMEAHPSFSAQDIREWIAFWSSRLGPGDQVYAKKLHNWGNQLSVAGSLPESDRPCHVLWSTMNILSDGTVALCCVDYEPKHPLGSVAVSSVEEIWHGQAAERMRILHAGGRRVSIPMCCQCTVWDDDQKIH